MSVTKSATVALLNIKQSTAVSTTSPTHFHTSYDVARVPPRWLPFPSAALLNAPGIADVHRSASGLGALDICTCLSSTEATDREQALIRPMKMQGTCVLSSSSLPYAYGAGLTQERGRTMDDTRHDGNLTCLAPAGFGSMYRLMHWLLSPALTLSSSSNHGSSVPGMTDICLRAVAAASRRACFY